MSPHHQHEPWCNASLENSRMSDDRCDCGAEQQPVAPTRSNEAQPKTCSCWIGRGEHGGWAPDRKECAVHNDRALAQDVSSVLRRLSHRDEPLASASDEARQEPNDDRCRSLDAARSHSRGGADSQAASAQRVVADEALNHLSARALDLKERLRKNRYEAHGDCCDDADDAVPCMSNICAIEYEAENLLGDLAQGVLDLLTAREKSKYDSELFYNRCMELEARVTALEAERDEIALTDFREQ